MQAFSGSFSGVISHGENTRNGPWAGVQHQFLRLIVQAVQDYFCEIYFV
jgi:hypothetical protein